MQDRIDIFSLMIFFRPHFSVTFVSLFFLCMGYGF